MRFVKFHDRLIFMLISSRPKGPITTTLTVDKSRTEADIRLYVVASETCWAFPVIYLDWRGVDPRLLLVIKDW